MRGGGRSVLLPRRGNTLPTASHCIATSHHPLVASAWDTGGPFTTACAPLTTTYHGFASTSK